MNYSALILLFLFSCSDLRTKPQKYPQFISLTTKAEPPKTHHKAYDEYVLNAPNFGVDQYHEGLKKYHSQDHGSLLCQPSSIAMALIYDRKFHPKGDAIGLKTLKRKNEVDAN